MRWRRPQDGFTLIELVIVLAIAALVLAAILLAVGGAQRSQRDTTTKNAAARVMTAFQNYASNNSVALPTFGTRLPASYLTNIYDGNGGTPRRGTQAKATAGKEIEYEWAAVCTNPGASGPIVETDNSYQYAVDYWVENGSTDVCIDNQ